MSAIKRTAAFSFLAVLLLGLGIAAPPPASAETLTLEEARSLALANSGELSSMLLAAESSELDGRLQAYESLPSLSLSSSASMQVSPAEDGVGDTLSAGLSLSASQTLWSGGRNGIKSAINAIAIDAARQAAIARYFSVLDEIDAAWYSFLKSLAALDAARSSLGNYGLALSIAETRFEAGAISVTDYLSAQSAHESAKTSLSQARRDVAISRVKVAYLTGLSSSLSEGLEAGPVDFAAYESLIARVSGFPDGDVESFAANVRDRAVVSNSDLNRVVLEGKKAEGELGLSRREYLPSVSAGLSAGLDYARVSGLADPSVRVSLSGTIPMEFWKTATSVKKSELASRIADNDLGKARMDLEIDIQTAVQNCVAQARTVLSSGKALEYAKTLYEGKLEMYRLSAASVSDLSDAAALVSSNESQLIAARYGFLSCLSDIRTICAFEDDGQVLGLIP